jgi:hypothetical protein
MNDSTKNTALDDLEALVSTLDTRLEAAAGVPADASKRWDAIDAVLGAAPRTTGVKSLREHETIQRFRKEFSDGLIRVDTARQLLRLIRHAVDTVMK